ncbi:hypothetical protein GGI00_004618, partial [Coemansia sp. RSA 2681]
MESNGQGNAWFKIYEQGYDAAKDMWCTDIVRENHGKLAVKIPTQINNGEYLLRTEIIALHNARTAGEAQFYPNCAQISVTGATFGSPELYPVSGIYNPTEPGILFDRRKGGATYKIPGPPSYALNMASLIDAVGECLVRLGSGNYDGSLAIVDGYLGQTSAMEASDSEAEPDYGGPHPLDVSIERRAALRSDDSYSESSSFSDAESFRDASSSPFWQDATHPPFRAGDDDHESDAAAGRAHMHTAESVLGSLRQLVQRERGWAREKAAYETHLAQMAVQLEQQSQVLQASAECSPATSAEPAVAPAAAASSHPTTAPAPATGDIGHPDESTTRGSTIQPSTNWWSAFLPAGATAMTHIPAFMALPTLSAGTSRFPAPSPACAVVPATGEEACLECIQ